MALGEHGKHDLWPGVRVARAVGEFEKVGPKDVDPEPLAELVEELLLVRGRLRHAQVGSLDDRAEEGPRHQQLLEHPRLLRRRSSERGEARVLRADGRELL